MNEAIMTAIRMAKDSAAAIADAIAAGLVPTGEAIAQVQRAFAAARGEEHERLQARKGESLNAGADVLIRAATAVDEGLEGCLPGTIVKLRSLVTPNGPQTCATLTGKGIKTPLGIDGSGTVSEVPKGMGADRWLAAACARPYAARK